MAKALGTAIISADSRQCYRELAIGTAKPSHEEMEGIPHYFIDSHDLKDQVTAADYESYGLNILEELFKIHDDVVLVGGSGMFVDALCIGLDPIPANDDIRQEFIELHDQKGLEHLQELLSEQDPEYYSEVDIQNPNRVIRALEVIKITGKTFSSQRKRSPKKRPFETVRFVLNHEREVLYERINHRVDLMIEAGLEKEAKSVMNQRELSSLNTVGYKELYAHYDGEYSREEAIDLIKRNSRRYAKRQITWLKRHPESHWIDWTNVEEVTDKILEISKK